MSSECNNHWYIMAIYGSLHLQQFARTAVAEVVRSSRIG
jgi:hypothetical protein